MIVKLVFFVLSIALARDTQVEMVKEMIDRVTQSVSLHSIYLHCRKFHLVLNSNCWKRAQKRRMCLLSRKQWKKTRSLFMVPLELCFLMHSICRKWRNHWWISIWSITATLRFPGDVIMKEITCTFPIPFQ